jgi:hypothetical protein
MLGLSKTGAAGAPATASPARGQVRYQRHAGARYRQARLMLDDSTLAENAVGDLIGARSGSCSSAASAMSGPARC